MMHDELLFYKAILYWQKKATAAAANYAPMEVDGKITCPIEPNIEYQTAIANVKSLEDALSLLKNFKD